jgi:FG-GAP-like repeat/Fibronectin type III domain
MTHALRLMVTTVLATSAILLPTGVAGAATPGPLDLTSITLSDSTLLPGDTATVSYTVASPDPLTFASFRYSSPVGPWGFTLSTSTPQITGTLSGTVPADTHPSSYVLQEIRLRDSAGTEIRYYRAGSTVQYPGATTGTHAITMGTMDLTVGYLPGAPSIEAVRARSASAVVFWGAPPGDGTPVSRYTITAQPGGRSVTTSGLADQVEVTGLTNGTTYRFTVTATDGFGTGPATLPSISVTPKMSSNVITTGDVTGDGRGDLIGLRSTAAERNFTDRYLYLYRGNGLGGIAGSTRLSDFFTNQVLTAFSPGDFDGNGSPDIMAVRDNGYLTLSPNNGHGGFTTGSVQRYIGPGWGTFLQVFSPGDFNGDRKSDVMAIGKDGGLYLYRGNGLGGFGSAGLRVGNGWAGFLTVFSKGDFSGDGKSDLMAVSKDGGLYLYRGNGLGGFAGAGQRIGNGWGGFLSVFAPGDFSGDRKSDVMAMNSAGELLLYRGNGLGGWAGGGLKIGKGWSIFR